ncbi:MAG: enoyl-CoA hydratase/isomerase family protein [Phycisphaerales bacterium]|jgi:enoyl-CoA hydratase/carnithine racemase|nr:enoyl-CoA hydratase/isomerase family protein [Phycisphaerales bacterium]
MSLIETTRHEGIVTLELNRPEKRNALSAALIEAMHGSLDALESDDTMRVLIIAGRGPCFCAGMDLRGVLDDAEAMGGMLRRLATATGRIRQLAVPTIARIHGAAIGGGCGLAAVTDFAVTHPEAKLGYPEVTLGVCPAVVAPWLIRKIGAGPARAMLLQGGTVTGEAALAMGLVDALHEPNDLTEQTVAMAAKLATGGRDAIAVTKQWLNALDGSLDPEMLERGAEHSARIIAGDEAQARLRPLYGG